MTGDAVKIYFCDICNESIPLKDLEMGTAITIRGKVICPHCNPQSGAGKPLQATSLSPTLPTYENRSRFGLSGVISVLALAVGGAGLALFYLERENNQRKLQTIDPLSRSQQDQSLRLEKILDEQKQLRADFERLREQLATDWKNSLEREKLILDSKTDLMKERLEYLSDAAKQTEALRTRLDQFEAWRGATNQNFSSIKSDIEIFTKEIREVKEAVAKVSAVVSTPAAGFGANSDSPLMAPVPGWDDILRRLKDTDSGVRWNAIIDLGQTGDPRAIPHLIPMLKDSDVFVRENAVRTLGDLDAKGAVGDLIEAMTDSERLVRESSYTVLKKITKQGLKFDPDARREERERSIQAWRDWWNANKSKFLPS